MPGATQAVRVKATDDQTMTRRFNALTGTVFLGLTIRVADFTDDQFIQIQLTDGAFGYQDATVNVGIRNQAGNPFYARLGKTTTNSTTHFASNDVAYRLVARFSPGGSGNYEQADLWVDPAAESDALAASQGGKNTGISQLTYFNVRTHNFGPSTLWVDDVRIGTSFGDVVPEPGTLALAALGAAGLALRRRNGMRAR